MSLQHSQPTRQRPSPTWFRALIITVGFVAVLWVLEVIDSLDHNRLDAYGVRPRSLDGLPGILFAPLLHAGWTHLESNTLPVLVLGFVVLLSGIGRGLAVTAIIWLVSGLGVWLISPANTVTIGASVLIFGWLVYLIGRGFFTRHPGEIALGIVLLLAYGGVLLGVLPGQPGVSWQGHLFGAIGGALAASWVSVRTPRVARDRRLPS